MSVQFGKCNFDGKPVDPEDLAEVRPALAPYGPDGEGFICKDNFGVLYRAFHTTAESRREVQPHICPSGSIITWDGRLDNRQELIRELGGISADSTDVEIVAAAYGHWETESLALLNGDWALSIWDPIPQSLILAKDFAGTRHLYYSTAKNRVTWCTVLDPLVLGARHAFSLNEEYVAGWLTFFPAAHLTPYVGIHSVPPAAFVRFTRNSTCVKKYWDFDPSKRTNYRTDDEYERHFREVLEVSLRRRLRSDSAILAELSGGMDSSSIVCLSDRVTPAECNTIRLDTISYYDDREPNWNERPYFTKVEEQRGHPGCHVDVGSYCLPLPHKTDLFAATPAAFGIATDSRKHFSQHVVRGGYRVLLSGVGGDEALGGVPTPTPELADLLVRGQFQKLGRQLKRWALQKRKPWIHLLLEAVRTFFPATLVPLPKHLRPAPWLEPGFVHRNQFPLSGYWLRTRWFNGLPSFQDNLSALVGVRRQLACDAPMADCCLERRYPYLDRDLLEFIYSIPREQIVRPGQRRSLMRRSLAGIVPDEIINRRRKAYVARAQVVAVGADWSELLEAITNMASSSIGIVNRDVVLLMLKHARNGGDVAMVPLIRTLCFEFWLRSVIARGCLSGPQLLPNLSQCSYKADPSRSPLRVSAS